GVAGDQAQLREHRVRGRAGIMNQRPGLAHELPHQVARQGVRRGAAHGGRRPFIGIVVRLVQREPRRTGGRREHLQGRTEPPRRGAPTPTPTPAPTAATATATPARRRQRGAAARGAILRPAAPRPPLPDSILASRAAPSPPGISLLLAPTL